MVSTTQELADVRGIDYVVIGVSVCHRKNAEGKTDPVELFEPIPATALEAMSRGTRTSFTQIYAATVGELFDGERLMAPADILGTQASFADAFVERLMAAARTYKAKPHLRLLPAGSTCSAEAGVFRLKYDVAFRRILGPARTVSDNDNVKQHAHTHRVLI